MFSPSFAHYFPYCCSWPIVGHFARATTTTSASQPRRTRLMSNFLACHGLSISAAELPLLFRADRAYFIRMLSRLGNYERTAYLYTTKTNRYQKESCSRPVNICGEPKIESMYYVYNIHHNIRRCVYFVGFFYNFFQLQQICYDGVSMRY